MTDSQETAVSTAAPKRKKKKTEGVWITLWAPLPIEESARALKAAGTIGFAIYAAICKQRFMTAPQHRSAFFCSENNISFHCGISTRRIREPLRMLESAGIVKITRPQGIEKVNHTANRITLLPIFTDGNKPNSRPDVSSGSNRTNSPVESGHEVGTNLSVNAEYPLKGGTHAAVSDSASVDASSTADELRDAARYTTAKLITADLVKDGMTKAEAKQSIAGFFEDGSLAKADDGRLYWKEPT
jgi:hypothetical protein